MNNLKRLVSIFHEQFSSTYNTEVVGGFDEPFYKPESEFSPAQIQFRHDYVSSALHEIAHWAVAGNDRRQLEDYGYWYEPDGRSDDQQREFVRVEARPQAVEWYLSLALGVPFRVSSDNLSNPADLDDLKDSVFNAFTTMITNEFPPRARQLAFAIAADRSVNLSNRASSMERDYLDRFWE